MKKCQKLQQKQKNELQNIIDNSGSSGREVRRAQAVLLLDQEVLIQLIQQITKYSYRQIFVLRKKYLHQGIGVIQDQRKGQPKELLTKKQQLELVTIIQDEKPKNYGYDSDYWTTSILGNLIKEKYQVQYKSKTSLYLIFKQAKFSFHKPDRQYQAKNPEKVEAWEKTAIIKLNQALKEKETIILTADEMSLSTQTTVQKIWLPIGEYPEIKVATKREARSLYGFLNIKTGKEHAFKTKWQNMYLTAEVLKQLRTIYPTQKLLLFWDQAPWHKGSKAQQFIKEDGNIETDYFPRAAPDENPQEHVWKKGRSQITHNRFIENIDEATDEFVNYLNTTIFPYSFLGFSARS